MSHSTNNLKIVLDKSLYHVYTRIRYTLKGHTNTTACTHAQSVITKLYLYGNNLGFPTKLKTMAKFEANIPSYLRSGAGSVPIDNNFAKVDSEPGNLSQVIDNYTNNFSGVIKSPDDMSMSAPSMEMDMAPKEMPVAQAPVEEEINPLDLESIIKPAMKVEQEPTIPSDADIEDILVA